jgi:hypothetical protein
MYHGVWLPHRWIPLRLLMVYINDRYSDGLYHARHQLIYSHVLYLYHRGLGEIPWAWHHILHLQHPLQSCD